MRSIGFLGLAIVAASVLAYSGKTASIRPAIAQSEASYQLPPTGDVWIADAPRSFMRGATEATARQDVPTGDVWATGL